LKGYEKKGSVSFGGPRQYTETTRKAGQCFRGLGWTVENEGGCEIRGVMERKDYIVINQQIRRRKGGKKRITTFEKLPVSPPEYRKNAPKPWSGTGPEERIPPKVKKKSKKQRGRNFQVQRRLLLMYCTPERGKGFREGGESTDWMRRKNAALGG